MSFFLPEGTQTLPFDSEQRSLWKYNEILYEANPNVPNSLFPEGNRPLPGDNELRSLIKINSIRDGGNPAPNPCTFPTTGISAYWSMDEVSGTRADASGNGNTLTLGGGAVDGVPGILSNAASFDGSTVHWLEVANPALAAAGQAITISGWVKLNDVSVDQAIAGKSDNNSSGYRLFFSAISSSMVFESLNSVGPESSQLVSSVTISSGVWYYVVAGFDGVNHFMSINNSARETDAGNFSSNSAHAFKIGNDEQGFILNGLIDEFGVWVGTALTDDDISCLYNSGIPTGYP